MWYSVTRAEPALDPAALDPDEPFEIDAANRPHLFKHHARSSGQVIALGEEDVYDVFYHDPQFERARHGPAEWLMVGEVPGDLVLVVPLAPSRSGDASRARPIGIYQATRTRRSAYRKQQRNGA